MPAGKTGSKELDDLVAKRFKRGYRLERKGSGHYRVLDQEGNEVEHSGKAITLSGTMAGGRAFANSLARLENAGVLKPTNGARPQRTHRRESIAKTLEIRRANRQAAADKLYERLLPLLEPVGGLHHPQMVRDLGAIGSMLGREIGVEGWTPDLASQSATQIANHNWVIPKYAEAWEELARRLEKAPDKQAAFFALVREAKGIPELRVKVRPAEEGEWPFEVRLLRMEELLVDHGYQRPVAWPFVRREAARFDASLVGTIDVAERGRGAVFAVLDGQQRMEICKMNGKTTIWASIYSGLDLASEARFFLHKNRDRKVVHPYYTFRARVTAKDPEAVAIEGIVTANDYVLAVGAARPDTSLERNIAAIAAIEEAYKTVDEEGRECLTPTLLVLRKSTLGRQNGQNGLLIRGLARLFRAHPELDDKHLGEVIAARGPDFLLGKSREGRYGDSHTGGAGYQMARALRDEYNRGLTQETKLTGAEI
jgi:hypothetical protein